MGCYGLLWSGVVIVWQGVYGLVWCGKGQRRESGDEVGIVKDGMTE